MNKNTKLNERLVKKKSLYNLLTNIFEILLLIFFNQ